MSFLGLFTDLEIKKIEEELKMLKDQKYQQDMARMVEYEKQFVTERDATMLAPLHPIIKVMVRKTLVEAGKHGIVCQIDMDGRTSEKQAELYALGRKLDINGNWIVVDQDAIVTNAMPGHSAHEYFLAVDIVMSYKNKPGYHPTWDDFVDANKDSVNDWTQLGAIGKGYGLQWGGDFKPPAPVDVPHFQYIKPFNTVTEIFEVYKKGGIELVWSKII